MGKKAKKKQLKAGLLFEGGDIKPQPHWFVKKLIRVKTPYIDDLPPFSLEKLFKLFFLIAFTISIGYFLIGPGRYIFLKDEGHDCDRAHLEKSILLWPPSDDGISFNHTLGDVKKLKLSKID